jgi:UDP-N-acetylglucosamine 2-epimerase (non-hydrolysing)
VGSGSHAVQTARIIERLEPVLGSAAPDWLVLYGDVNSTLAGALVAAKMGIRIAHVEAGLRSGDWAMPEEINRIVTDRLSDLLLIPSRDAGRTLLAEGEDEKSIVFVGNVMIDSLFHGLQAARATGFRGRHDVDERSVVVTLHRPSNVDDREQLALIAESLRAVAMDRKVFFTMHPRTRSRIDQFGIDLSGVTVLEPLDYLEMLDLMSGSFAAITDSGGIQEETTALGIPCLTVRTSTERPITIHEGTNQLVPDPREIPERVAALRRPDSVRRPEGWDGGAGPRVIRALLTF